MIVVVLALVACDKHQESKPATNEPKPNDVPFVPVKQVVPTKALPALASDGGGATGKPIWQAAFGGFGIDVPRGVAVGADGAVYVAGYFDGEDRFRRQHRQRSHRRAARTDSSPR